MIDAYRDLARQAGVDLAPYVRDQLAALLPHLQAGLAVTPAKD